MNWIRESRYTDTNVIPGEPLHLDTGANLFELVLQTRDPVIDSDLTWIDAEVLAKSPIETDSLSVPAAHRPGTTERSADRAEPRSFSIFDLDLLRLRKPEISNATPRDAPETGDAPAHIIVSEFKRSLFR